MSRGGSRGRPSASSLPLRSGSPQEEPPASAGANFCCRSFDKHRTAVRTGLTRLGSQRSSRRPPGVCPHQPAGCAEALLPAPGATVALAGTGAARAAGLTCVWSRRAGQQRRNSRNSQDNRGGTARKRPQPREGRVFPLLPVSTPPIGRRRCCVTSPRRRRL